MKVKIIGGGLAGCECAYQLAKKGINVTIYEMKPKRFSPAHESENFAEIVCSNSFKSNSITNACGLLKEEMRRLGSVIIKTADDCSVPAGQALAVDRGIFSSKVTEIIATMENITVVREEVKEIDLNDNYDITVIATGPLTSELLYENIQSVIGEKYLHFYDAAAPIISADSIDYSKVFKADRYGKGDSDYINCPMTKEQYYNFYKSLINAECAKPKDFEKNMLFEGCMPIEEMAKRGEHTLVYGPLKPVGFDDVNKGDRPYAVVQLRQDNKEGTMYNLVGFQTSLKWGEQDKVFKMIPGLENAEILRYGVMHRNTYINAPKIINEKYMMKNNNKIYFAGQISGVEGYVESSASGLIVALDILKTSEKLKEHKFSNNTIIGAISNYIASDNKSFQPMNANFGLLNPLDERIKDKRIKYEKMAKRSLDEIEAVINEGKSS